jgi:uncharacterized protein (DUF2141 family)
MPLPRRFGAAVIAVAASMTIAAQSSANSPGPTPPAGCTGTASATWVTVTAEGLRNGHGQLAVTVYEDNPRKFLVHHGAISVGRVPASAGTARACVFLPRPGVYALALYHDENANEKFDRSMIGLPAEGYGFSNNPATLVGLPSFRSVRINIARTGLSTRIQMKYP